MATENTFLCVKIFIIILKVCVFVCLYMGLYMWVLVPRPEGGVNPQSWSDRWLWAAALGAGNYAKALTLNCWAKFLACATRFLNFYI